MLIDSTAKPVTNRNNKGSRNQQEPPPYLPTYLPEDPRVAYVIFTNDVNDKQHYEQALVAQPFQSLTRRRRLAFRVSKSVGAGSQCVYPEWESARRPVVRSAAFHTPLCMVHHHGRQLTASPTGQVGAARLVYCQCFGRSKAPRPHPPPSHTLTTMVWSTCGELTTRPSILPGAVVHSRRATRRARRAPMVPSPLMLGISSRWGGGSGGLYRGERGSSSEQHNRLAGRQAGRWHYGSHVACFF